MPRIARVALRFPSCASVMDRGCRRHRRRRSTSAGRPGAARCLSLAEEVAGADLVPDGAVAVEGLGGTATDLDAVLDDPGTRERVLAAVRRVEREPSLLGAGPHLLVAGRVPDDLPAPGVVPAGTTVTSAAAPARR